MQVTIKAGQRTIRLTKRETDQLLQARDILKDLSDMLTDIDGKRLAKEAADKVQEVLILLQKSDRLTK